MPLPAFAIAAFVIACLPASAQRPPSAPDARIRASVPAARDKLLRQYANAPVEQAQQAFRSFWRFYNETLGDLRSRFESGPFDGDLLQEIFAVEHCLEKPLTVMERSRDPRMARLAETHAAELRELREWRRCGFDFSWGEGDWYLRDDPEFIAGAAAKLPLGDLADWVAFWSREGRQRLAEDAGLVVGWDDIRQRLIRWEDFARRHPDLPETRIEVRPQVNGFLSWYLFGIDNSPAYDTPHVPAARTFRLDPALKTSYERFIKENASSSFHDLIAGAYAILGRHDYSPESELFAFLRSHLTGSDDLAALDSLRRRVARRYPH